jgi:hypothetical protein
VNVGTTFEATKTTEMMHPGMRTLDDPTVSAQTAAVFGATPCNHRLDASY